MLPVFNILNGTYVNITGFQMIPDERLPLNISTVSSLLIFNKPLLNKRKTEIYFLCGGVAFFVTKMFHHPCKNTQLVQCWLITTCRSSSTDRLHCASPRPVLACRAYGCWREGTYAVLHASNGSALSNYWRTKVLELIRTPRISVL